MIKNNLTQVELPNGIRLLYDNIPGYRSFILSISVLIGSRQDPKGKEGLAHFIEHQLFRRNQKYSYTKIAREFEKTGTLYNAFTEHEITVFYLKSLNENFNKVYHLLSDFIICPVFNKSDYLKEKKIILEEIKSYQDDPEEYIFDLGNEIVYPKHPLGRLITGTEKTLENISLDDLITHFNTYYNSKNIVISLVGDIPFEQFYEITAEIFNDFKSGEEVTNSEKLPPIKTKEKIYRKNIEQSHILLLKRIDDISPDYILKLKLLSYFLGESPSSLIYHSLREKSALVYNIFSNLEQYKDTNVLQIYFATDKEQIEKSFKILDNIFQKIIDKKVSKELFQISKNAMIAQHIYKMELPYERMMNDIRAIQLNESYSYISHFIDKIKSISFNEFIQFSSNLLSQNDWSKVQFLQK